MIEDWKKSVVKDWNELLKDWIKVLLKIEKRCCVRLTSVVKDWKKCCVRLESVVKDWKKNCVKDWKKKCC